MRPVIGINGSVSEGEISNITVRSTYVDAVLAAGGTPIVLPAVGDPDVISAQVSLCDGFIFGGGPDIDPVRFGQEPHPTYNPISERREKYDFALIREVMRVRKPFLAVCLGCQEINVALGGTIIQDINSETSTTVQHIQKQEPYQRRHEVTVEKGTRIYDLVGTTTLSTNSAHHQAVRKPAPGVRIAARCTADGIIEGIELTDYDFGLGIQWHPEYLIKQPEHLRLFEGLVRAAKSSRAK